MIMATRLMQRLMLVWLSILTVSAGQIAVWALDRTPPFAMLSYYAPPTQRGTVLHLTGEVMRDVERGCGVIFSRHLIDAQGYRIDLTTSQRMSAAALTDMDRVMPQKLFLAVHIPAYTSPGRARLATVLQYECNPLHRIWPIPVEMTIDFEVLP